jgi:hypothetical protein
MLREAVGECEGEGKAEREGRGAVRVGDGVKEGEELLEAALGGELEGSGERVELSDSREDCEVVIEAVVLLLALLQAEARSEALELTEVSGLREIELVTLGVREARGLALPERDGRGERLTEGVREGCKEAEEEPLGQPVTEGLTLIRGERVGEGEVHGLGLVEAVRVWVVQGDKVVLSVANGVGVGGSVGDGDGEPEGVRDWLPLGVGEGARVAEGDTLAPGVAVTIMGLGL